MAKALPFSCMPFPLGLVKPTPNTPLKITSNFTDIDSTSVNSLWVQAPQGNAGLVYILCQLTATAKDTTAYSNVVAVLSAGSGISFNGKWMNQVLLGNLWIDPVSSGDGAFCSIQQI